MECIGENGRRLREARDVDGGDGDGVPRARDGEERGFDAVERVILQLGKAGGAGLFEGKERAHLDVAALVLVREVEGGVELREAGRRHLHTFQHTTT